MATAQATIQRDMTEKPERVFPDADMADLVAPEKAHVLNEPYQYWILNEVCCIFYPAPYPEVWMVHFEVADTTNRVAEDIKAVLGAFWDSEAPGLILTHVETDQTVAPGRNALGFSQVGLLSMEYGNVALLGWRKCH